MKIVLIIPFLFPLAAFAQGTSSITGTITDKLTGKPLHGASISIRGVKAQAVADSIGQYILQNVHAGESVVEITHVGYEDIVINVKAIAGTSVTADAAMLVTNPAGTEVVVSASKRAEKITRAPASIKVIGQKDIAQYGGSNMLEMFSKVEGVEYVRYGIDGIILNARGFNSAFNTKVLQMVDGRNSMSPGSGGLPLGNNTTSIKEDIEQMEIVLGPQSALYGPNAHNALLNTITKDPRKYQGTTVGLTGGSRYQFSARLRQAAVINKKWAYKLTGEYATGKDFIFYDSVKAGGSVFGTAVVIPERNPDFDFRHLRGEGHLYYSISTKADIIVSAGGSNNNYIQVTNSARNQIRGLAYSFIQARFVHPRFFVNVYNAWGTLGTSYGIAPYTRDYWNETHRLIKPMEPDKAEIYAMRLGNQFKEENQRINADAQYNYTFIKIGLALITGASYQKDKPNAFGYTLVDKDQRIYVTQAGAVLQLEKTLPWDTKLTAAGRLDHHSNFGNFFAPKLALVKEAGKGAFRFTWGRAYSMPSILFQYSNVFGNVFGNGLGVKYAPNGPNYKFNSANPTITNPLVPEEISTWEIGYKGTIARKLFIDINYYNGLSHNFLSPSQAVGGRALSVGDIPVTHNKNFAGRVSNDTLYDASFLTYFNYGDVRAYGLDAALNYMFNKHISLGIKYSWFGSDITSDNMKNDANKDGVLTTEEKSLNAPKNRLVATLGFQQLCMGKLFVNVAARYLQQYDFYSGNQIGTAEGEGNLGRVLRPPPLPPLPKNFDRGPLGGFTTFDLSAGYKANELVSLVMGITNLMNIEQQEFVGCPPIGRLISFEVKIHVPNSNRK